MTRRDVGKMLAISPLAVRSGVAQEEGEMSLSDKKQVPIGDTWGKVLLLRTKDGAMLPERLDKLVQELESLGYRVLVAQMNGASNISLDLTIERL